MRHLSLDHLTVADTTPAQLATVAAEAGYDGICLFLHPMAVVPDMPNFELIGDTPERRGTRDAMRSGALTLDLVYPFTLGGRTEVASFEPAFETAAWLGGRLANVLCYDRDPVRRLERLEQLAELAGAYDIGLSIEFYPPAQVRTLSDARAAIDALPNAGIGITLDLLHLVRGGEAAQAMGSLCAPDIRIAQLCDGPASIDPGCIEREAGLERVLPGEGAFDCLGFLRALAIDVPISVEVPRQSAYLSGESRLARAHAALVAACEILRQL